MRGTRYPRTTCLYSSGIIPAYAGNTCVVVQALVWAWDHPRVCGEHGLRDSILATSPGSSPRMRGTLVAKATEGMGYGIIPAYAGNTQRSTSKPLPPRDHPRVCGEHHCMTPTSADSWGSSPRMRGTRHPMARFGSNPGIIPAYAGNTFNAVRNATSPQGSSPRMRGTH